MPLLMSTNSEQKTLKSSFFVDFSSLPRASIPDWGLYKYSDRVVVYRHVNEIRRDRARNIDDI
jgi:hypothetical protein